VGNESPTWNILLLLMATVGLPYFALSATSPLIQAWFSIRCPGRSPYRLYSLSNFGSLAALLTYPFLFEPAFDLPTQSLLWSGGFLLYAVLCGMCFAHMWRFRSNIVVAHPDDTDRPVTTIVRLCWLLLPACASLLLLAATNHICQDVASVPFLWVMPLSLYLLSFIVAFDHERWYVRRFWCGATVLIFSGVISYDYLRYTHPIGLKFELILNFAALFCACMVCHGELARLKPIPRHLTEYYLTISAGGALGGLVVAIVAPLIFSTYFEWQIGISAVLLLAAGLIALPGRVGRRGIICYAIVTPIVSLGMAYTFYWGFDAQSVMDRQRNFFGVVTVQEDLRENPQHHLTKLVHGRITHGVQLANLAKRHWPTTYYGEDSGVGEAMAYLHKFGPIRVGAVGLGAGTIAVYAKPGDVFRFFEINPAVLEMAKKHFTFLSDCQGKWEVVLGDARLSLEAEPLREKYNLLVIDAFSGDAIPTHLLTREAFEVYREHLLPDGIIAVHVSNTYLRLGPVVRTLAEHFGMKTVRIDGERDDERLRYSNSWILVTNNEDFVKSHPSRPLESDDDKLVVPIWTDQYSNLFLILSQGIGGF
jgi:spermidine synthase